MNGEPWDDFVGRHGDKGRDMALYIARQRCGLTLREIGEQVGMKDKAVSFACTSMKNTLKEDSGLSELYQSVLSRLGEGEEGSDEC